MDEFKVIVVMNEAMIGVLKDKNSDYSVNLKIQEYLKDEALFFKINKQNAYKILQKVGVKQEQLDRVYKKLISPNIFYERLNYMWMDGKTPFFLLNFQFGHKQYLHILL